MKVRKRISFWDYMVDNYTVVSAVLTSITIASVVIGFFKLLFITNGWAVLLLPALAAFGWYYLWQQYKKVDEGDCN